MPTKICPKCQKQGDIETAFGYRNMRSTNADGEEVIRRAVQSYCRDCRANRTPHKVPIVSKKPEIPMLPTPLISLLQLGMSDFLKNSFWTNTKGFTGSIDRLIDRDQALFQGPFLSVKLPFRSEETTTEYFSDVPMGFPPYLHQKQAFQRLTSTPPKSTVIATGTGSGKTECFLHPVVDYCYQNRSKPGIKAIIIYPMNALATDQAKRIAKLVYNQTHLKENIRVGLFIGQSAEETSLTMEPTQVITHKNTLRNSPPDILLTNYKMLDYLLSRPKNQKLWHNNDPSSLQFLIVDELHTFDGAQGTDLACLIRRLKGRLNTPENHLCCVGTSATLGNDSVEEMLAYPREVFGEEFDAKALISESRLTSSEFLEEGITAPDPELKDELIEALSPNQYTDAQEYVHAQMNIWFGRTIPSVQLGEELKSQRIFRNMIRVLSKKPLSLEEAIDRCFAKGTSLSRELRKEILTSLLSLAAYARTPYASFQGVSKKLAPYVQVQVQLWQRELRRMVASVAHQPELQFYDDLTNSEKRYHLPSIRCNDCGLMGWATVKREDRPSEYACNLRQFYSLFFAEDPRVQYLFPAGENVFAKNNRRLLNIHCQTLQHDGTVDEDDEQYVQIETTRDGHTYKKKDDIYLSRNCPRCESQQSLFLMGFQASTLTATYINQLFSSPFNSDKKLLTFSDSVQDAAHRAGFFEARTWRFNLRIAIQKVLDSIETTPNLQEFAVKVVEYWLKELGRDVFVATFIPPNLMWHQDYEYLITNGTLPDKTVLLDWASHRLRWEVYAEYSYLSKTGRSLPATGASVASLPLETLNQISSRGLAVLRENQPSLKDLPLEQYRYFVQGFTQRLIQRGAIYQHGLKDQYFETLGKHAYTTFKTTFWTPDRFHGQSVPLFLANRPSGYFDTIPSGTENSWLQDWVDRVLRDFLTQREVNGKKVLRLITEITKDVYYETLRAMENLNILEKKAYKGHFVWGLHPNVISVFKDVTRLRCSQDNHQLPVASLMKEMWLERLSLQKGSRGIYQEKEARISTYFAQMYRKGDIKRIIAREHTGLLKRSEREMIENQFKSEEREPWFPNLLSCTPTLEMGIDIGDLSSTILCSVPPTQSNYLQRVGRAGRRDGNSVILTIAGGRPHDLYFFMEPKEMLAGNVRSPGIFLDAAAVLKRQLIAYCFDCWAKQDGNIFLPDVLSEVIRVVSLAEPNPAHFPYSLTTFIAENRERLLTEFIDLFQALIKEDSLKALQDFILGEDGDSQLIRTILDRLKEQAQMYASLKEEYNRVDEHCKKLSAKKVKDEHTKELIDSLNQEREARQSLLYSITSKRTLAFFTDEGLLPNYAFPEAGVQLKSVIWRKKTNASENGKKYDHFTYEFERPSRSAIIEFAPDARFYTGGRKVTVDRIDVRTSKIENWQFCSSCSYTKQRFTSEIEEECPACGTEGFHDRNQTQQMLRLKQVYASTNDKDSRISDDAEKREARFFNHRMMVSADERNVIESYASKRSEIPFGYEYLSKCSFRDINFGQYSDQGIKTKIANEETIRTGFSICSDCGHVQSKFVNRGDKRKRHTFSCPSLSQPNYEEKITDCLFLYREFESEAIRFLLPFVHEDGSQKKMHSFLAALQMGVKLKFRGEVSHLESTIYSEPDEYSDERRVILALYDTVPGGTGYLRQISELEQLKEIFELALERLLSCSCNQEEHKDGCYRCLYAYRGSYEMSDTSRDTSVEVLNDILETWDDLEQGRKLNTLTVSGLLESKLEEQFIANLSVTTVDNITPKLKNSIIRGVKSGYRVDVGEQREQQYTIEPQVSIGQKEGISTEMRADFVFRSKGQNSLPVVVFTDGIAFHYERITKDMMQRMNLSKSGRYHTWSLTHWDVNPNPEFHFLDWIALLPPQGRDRYINLCKKVNADNLGKAHHENSMQWFIRFLHDSKDGKQFVSVAKSWLMVLLQLQKKNGYVRDWKQRMDEVTPSSLSNPMKNLGEPKIFSDFLLDYAGAKRLRLLLGVWSVDGALVFHGVVHLDDEDVDPTDPEFRVSWHCFLRLYNMLQFVPGIFFLGKRGAFGEDYSHLVEAVYGNNETSQYPKEWRELIQDEILEHHSELLKRFFELEVPLPNMDGEVIETDDGDTGPVEFLWEEQKIALFSREFEDAIADVKLATKAGYKSGFIEDYENELSEILKLFR